MKKIASYSKTIVAATMLLAGITTMFAAVNDGIRLGEPKMTRNGELMTVHTVIEFDGFKVKSSEVAVLSPMIVSDTDTLRLPGVNVYGRNNWYSAVRNRRLRADEKNIRYSKDIAPVIYTQSVPYAEWMNGSKFIVQRTDYGCAGCNEGSVTNQLAEYKYVEYEPTFFYETVMAETVKTRELSGRAYIDFPVNQTVIYPDYRRNATELQKIISTIDSVRNDRDITVTALSIKGFASPEGPYDNNVRLAKGRTAALKDYVQQLYHFAPGFITTSYEPEDWEGLRNYVEKSDIENREQILAIIDSDLAPDPKNAKIQTVYPKEYNFLYQTVYPGLRHSDYRIEYVIRSFSNPAEIRQVLRSQPQKLSLSEMYLAVQDLEPGSDEYNEVFETAVRMYPDVPAANVNAANAALQRGDTASAERYLQNAGDSTEAVYARGVLAAMKGEYELAVRLMETAASMGLKIDEAVLANVKEAAIYAQ